MFVPHLYILQNASPLGINHHLDPGRRPRTRFIFSAPRQQVPCGPSTNLVPCRSLETLFTNHTSSTSPTLPLLRRQILPSLPKSPCRPRASPPVASLTRSSLPGKHEDSHDHSCKRAVSAVIMPSSHSTRLTSLVLLHMLIDSGFSRACVASSLYLVWAPIWMETRSPCVHSLASSRSLKRLELSSCRL